MEKTRSELRRRIKLIKILKTSHLSCKVKNPSKREFLFIKQGVKVVKANIIHLNLELPIIPYQELLNS